MPGTVYCRYRVWASWCCAVLRQHTAAQQYGHFLGIDLIVFGLAAMDGLPGEDMTEDKRKPMFRPEVSKPVPGQHGYGCGCV